MHRRIKTMHDYLQRWQSAFVVFLLVFTVFTIVPVNAVNQANSRISTFPAPTGVLFHGVSWNEDNYAYAIAVGEDSAATDTGQIFRFDPENGWTNFSTVLSNGEIIYDAVYYKDDSFFILGDNGGECDGYLMEGANTATPSFTLLNNVESAGSGFTAGCYDPFYGSAGALVGVGTPYTDYGMISWYDIGGDTWYKISILKTASLKDVACDSDPNTQYVIAVGQDSSTGKAVAYLCDYSDAYPIEVPADAADFTAVSWDTASHTILITGTDTSGNTRLWQMYHIRQTMYVAFSNYDDNSLSVMYNDGLHWTFSSVDAAQYPYPSLAIDWYAVPHITYRDGATQEFRHAWFIGGRWLTELVDSNGDTGYQSSLAVDYGNNLQTSYCEWGAYDLMYAKYNGTAWATENVDSTDQVGSWSSLAIQRGSLYPSVAYYDDTNKDIKYNYKDYYGWHPQYTGSTVGDAKEWISLYLNFNNQPSISYYDSLNAQIRYTSYDGSAWNDQYVTDADTGYTDMAVWRDNRIGISYIDAGGLCYSENNGGTWNTDIGLYSAADYTSIAYDMNGDPVIVYHDSTSGLNMARFYHSNNTWSNSLLFGGSNPQYNGRYNDIVLGVQADFRSIKGTEGSSQLNDIDWEPNGQLAIAVGNNGEVFVYYPGHDSVSDWSDSSFTDNLYSIAVKPKGSPGYGIAVGESASVGVISYQVYNSDTEITADSSTPHINVIDIKDNLGQSRLNKQSDVGNTYTFFLNCSYDLGWAKVGGLDISAWYDFGNDDIAMRNYNDTAGKNYNFHLHFTPDSTDPVNNGGVWRLLWPNGTDEVRLVGWYQKTEDRSGFMGSIVGADEFDYFHLYVNITFGEQLVFAPGQGWSPSTNQSDPALSFNDLNSWNFNATIYDATVTTARESKYDEFGIYAYTEITAINNPTGSGAPGSLIYLNPASHIGVRANLPYKVQVNISDMVGERDSTHKISRTAVHVLNNNGYANSTNSQISTWTAFPSSPVALYVWGTDTYYMPNLDDGTWSAGLQGGYDDVSTYTAVFWDLAIPPSTPDDRYRSTVIIEITY